MPGHVRLFVAVNPPAEVTRGLRPIAAGLHARRRTDPRDWHVTLAFLGPVPLDRVPGARAALDAVVPPATPITLRVAGGGTFDRGGRVSVLWAGITGDTAALTALAGDVRTRLGAAGLPCDERPPHPHLTLAFPSPATPPARLAADLAALDRHTSPAWTVSGFELMAVRDEPGGRRYESIGAW